MTSYGDRLPKGLVLPKIEGKGNDYSFLESKAMASNPNIPISVVLPVYNRIDMLRRTMAMLTHQTYPLDLIEVIIADDGSSDHPEQLILEFEEYFDVNYVRQKDLGYRLSHVRNLGVRAAKHDNIIILDCDMAPVPNLVELYAKWLCLEEKVLLIGHRRYVDANDIHVEEVLKSPSVMLELPPVATKNAVMKQSPSKDWREAIYSETDNLKTSPHPFRASSCGNVGFNRRIFSDAGPFDESFTAWGAEDNEFGYRVMNAGYYFIPLLDALGLHQEPPGGREFVDREAGKLITRPMLLDMVPTYRDYDPEVQSTTSTVSIYIPAYNAKKTIDRAIQSALDQTYRDFDIVVCNDGSTDGTGEHLDMMYSDHPKIQIIHQANGGIGSASNACIGAARGLYILQLDSDDELLPDAIETLLPEIRKDPAISCVYGRHYKWNQQEDTLEEAWYYPTFTRERMLHGMIVHHPRMFRKRDWSRVGGFSESLLNAVDYDFFQKLSEVGEIEFHDHLLYKYALHEQSTSISKSKVQTENTFLTMKNALERMRLMEWNVVKDHSYSGLRAVKFTRSVMEIDQFEDQIFVSVVIITRNRSELLSDAIRSVLNQSYENFELLVVDDGSDDETEEAVKQFADLRIRYLKKEASGIPKSRNIGVQMAKGEYIVIMDDDDLMMPNRIQEQLDCLSDGSSGSYGGWIDQDANLNHEYFSGGEHGYSQILFGGKIMLHPASMIKRSVLLEFPYDENYSYGTDYIMNLEIARAGHKLDHTGSYILLRRFHGGNVTLTNSGEQKNTARVRWQEFVDGLDKDTERRMRDEWRNTKFFSNIFKPNKEILRRSFPWISMFKRDKIEVGTSVKTDYAIAEHWSQVGQRLIFDASGRDIFFEMPIGWDLNNTHADILRIAHHFLCSPWDRTILNNWEPTRQKGWRCGLAFSAGVDSTACMELMPPETVLMYHQRDGFESKLNHANALRFIEKLRENGKQVVIVKSNHEQIRLDHGKSVGFSTDFAGAVHVILLADYFELGSIAMGMPLENAYLFHGHKGRDFNLSSYWKTHSSILEKAGLDLVYPTSGASEIINQRIVDNSDYTDYAESCLRSKEAGKVCGKCWKCFRKNSMKGKEVQIQGEIETFLNKKPLKQAISTLYAIQRLPQEQQDFIRRNFTDLNDLMDGDYSLIERYNPMFLDLIPDAYRTYVAKKLNNIAEPMSDSEVETLLSIDLFAD